MTTFQRKHYQAIANVIKMFPVADRVKFVAALDDMFKADNEQYDRSKFTKACDLAKFQSQSEVNILREKGLL